MSTRVLKKLSTAMASAIMIALGSSTSAVRGSTRFFYTVTELGNLPGYTNYDVYAINDLGQAVGSTSPSRGASHAFLWQNGKMTDLGTLGGESGYATSINNKGQVVGNFKTSDGIYHAFLWQNGRTTDLGTLGGKDSFAHSINNKGQVVGYSYTSSLAFHAFLWQNGKLTDLGTLGGEKSFANSINNKGQVVGDAQTSDGIYHAFLWQNGKMKSLAELSGKGSFTASINNQGQVVGSANTQRYIEHCVLWSGGTIQDMSPRLQKFGLECSANSINNLGTFVGNYLDPYGYPLKPFVWRDGGKIILDQRVLPVPSQKFFDTVDGINDKGQLIVNGFDQTHRAYLLTPTWVTQ